MVAPPETALPSSQPFASSENIHASSADEMGFDTASLARNNSGWISGSESPVFPSSSFETPVLTGSFERPGISISLDNPLTRPTTSASATLTSSSLLQNISYTEHTDTTNRSEHSLAYATPTGSISTGFVVQKGSPLVKISNSANLLLDVNINFEGCLPGSDCASTKSPGFVSSKGSVLGMTNEPVKGDKYESNACQLMPADSLGSFKNCTSFFESSHVDGSVGLDGSAKGIGQDIGRGTISTQLEPVESNPSMGMKTSLEGPRHDNSEPLASAVYHQENVISASVESETSREQRETTAVVFEGAGSRVVADLCLVVGGVLLLI
ncbi:hypothetical protein JCM33374_g6295 [Metschnikowia sp. JCM 33374]|nr:hypothetical protein JCM33374_g6295 [Metschnikowia sp. JCM 33374]